MKTLLIILVLFSTSIVAQTNTIVDTDGDGLIEINDLETLNAIRFQLDGASYKTTTDTTAGITEGCPNDRCIGYELTRNLDFSGDDSYSSTANRIIWTTGEGWQPIGDSSNAFTGKFEGNGFTIFNLKIDRSDTENVGLFGFMGQEAEIANIGLLNVNIVGDNFVGSLVGNNAAIITNSYATGSVSGAENIGGLVGRNEGTVANSYATSTALGSMINVGGLVGLNSSGTIENSYATGTISGASRIGGLVGLDSSGTIENSYATGSVSGNTLVGGLVGHSIGNGRINESYWDSDTSGRPTSDGGDAMTTAALQSQTMMEGIYSNWDDNDWDFGTDKQYPVLKYANNTNMVSDECRLADDTPTDLPICGSLLSPTLRYGLSELQLVQSKLSPDFDVIATSYRGAAVSSTSTIQFRPIMLNPDAKVYITAEGQTRGLALDSGDESSMISLNTNGITTITVEVENGGETTQTVIYTLYLHYEFSRDVDRDDDGLIEIDDLETLNAIRNQLDGSHLQLSGEVPTSIGCVRGRCKGYELTRDLDFDDDDSYSSPANKIIWTTGAGWQPIGDSSNAFTGKFEGNGFTISNLKIDRSDASYIGLFGLVGREAEIANISLLNVDITGDNRVGGLVGESSGIILNSYATGSVSGDDYVGSLVGLNGGAITNSYTTGSVSGVDYVGGLVGWNARDVTNSYAAGSAAGDDYAGGLVGFNAGTVTSSYATSFVSGDRHIGGLVGWNARNVTSSYATSSVRGSSFVGGLVGFSDGDVTNSYATSSAWGSSFVGGLVGRSRGTITNSYWDRNTSGITTSAGGMSQTTVALQSPTTATGIYSSWSSNNWDFGMSSQYPVLKYRDNPNTDSSECRSASDATMNLPICGSLLSPTLRYGLSELQLVQGYLSPDFNVVVPNYRGTAVNGTNTIQFRPITVNPNAKVYIMAGEQTRGLAIDSSGESSMISLNTNGITTITVEVENGGETTQTVIYTLYLHYEFSRDVDRDGLIEINDLETLNAIRFQLDGASYKTTTDAMIGITEGCPNDRCIGYELTRNLDFNDDNSYSSTANRVIWTTGAGWQPIGDSSSNAFIGKFEGNGFTISNLKIDRSDIDYVGLFGFVGQEAEITNVGLLNVDIIGADAVVGGLVGGNGGTVANSYATGSVEGSGNGVGGLVGASNGIITDSYATGSVSGVNFVGGLVGWNSGGITNSYATGTVTGVSNVGGLVGLNRDGTINNSYATGSVSGSSDVGGLVGLNRDGTINNSYATGSVSGSRSDRVGGLVGLNRDGIITNSYWDSDTSGRTTSAGGTSKTTVELQSPTTAIGIYSSWSNDAWDFGTSSQYPVLKYTDNPNTDSSECRSVGDTSTDLPICGSLLSPTLRYGLSELQLVQGNLSPDFNVVVPNYRGTVVNSTSTVQFRPITVNPDAKVYITTGEQTRGLAINSGDESSMISLNTDGITTITVEVENGGETTQTVIYALYLNYYEFDGDVDGDDDGLIEIDDLEGLNAIRHQLDGIGYRESETAPKVAIGCPNNQCRGYELTRNLDFNDDNSYSSTANRIIWTTGAGWQPIGDFFNLFTGKFEGNGFTISNLKINRPGTNNVGLFGVAGPEAQIANMSLLNVDITGNSHVGGLVGDNRGTITNSYATGFASGTDDDVGGLVGDNRGAITNSYATGFASGTNNDVGGLVGDNSGTITNSYATGSVSGSRNHVGGLVGFSRGTITNSYATGTVSGSSDVGGLVGWNNDGTITNGHATGSVSGSSNIGGLVGRNRNDGTITNSYATGSVSGSSNIGGLVGANDDGTITNSYATGSVSGSGNSVGGLVGDNRGAITNSRATSSVSGSGNGVGGLIGWNLGTVTNSYATGFVLESGNGVGGLVGWNSGGITNSHATGSISGGEAVGGLVGGNLSSGTIDNSYATGSVRGSGNSVGGLVGGNNGTITNSYATGFVSGVNFVGGLVGANSGGDIANSYATGPVSGSGNSVGGLVGWNSGTITNSYATGFVSGVNFVGGLVGANSGGNIANSYATGPASGSGNSVGGLVGWNSGTITNSYATGSVSGSGNSVGGLVGFSNNINIMNSYWDSDTSGVATGAWGTGKNTMELQSPTTATGIYISWSNDDWDFGTSSQYPVLKYTDNPNTDSSECRSAGDASTDLPICGSLLSPTLRYGLSELQLVAGELSPDFNVVVPDYRGTAINSTSTVQFRPITVTSDAKVYITADEQTRGQAIDSGDESSMISLNTNGITTITVEVENDGETAQTIIYTLYLHYEYRDVDRDDDGLIEIDDLETLNAIRNQLDGSQLQLSGEAPTSIGCASGGCNGYELTRDLDFDEDDSYSSPENWMMILTTGAGWQPIGDSSSNAFASKFEGNGFTISNLKINRSGTNNVGLFGFVGQAAEITNVGLLDVDIIGGIDVGGLVGINRGTITNSYATGSVSGAGSIGGLVGLNNGGTITNSYATGDVAGSLKSVGGLVGLNDSGGTITNSYATGAVTGLSSSSRLGGLVGWNDGTITNSYATGTVSGASDIGGLVGWTDGGTITNSYATGDVTGKAANVGGLVGFNSGGTITNSYATGDVTGEAANVGGLVGLQNGGTTTNSYATGDVRGSGNDIGGLVGVNLSSGTITNSYATGDVAGSGFSVGGLVGRNDGIITNSYATGIVTGFRNGAGGLVGFNFGGTITNSYATGAVTGSGNDIGGLVGENRGGTITNSYATGTVTGSGIRVGGLVGYNNGGTIMRSYWDINTSGITTGVGGTSKTTAELQSPVMPGSSSGDTYHGWTNDNWDFGTSSQYPVLKHTDNLDTDSSECRRAGDTSTDLDLPLCGSLLSPTMRGLSELQLVAGELSPDFDVAVPNYRGTVANSTSTIRFRPITINPDAKVYITTEGQTRGLAINSGDESSMISLNTDGITTITVEVENGGETTQTVIYTLDLYYEFGRGLDRDDVDRDDDGLIEIDDLETLNAIRNQLDGSHLQLNGLVPTSMGCARGGCKGYELTRDLDFNDDASYSSTANRVIWTTGAGWQPIGDSSSNAFIGKFEGNGFTISNLKIDRSDIDYVGLFGFVGQEAEITNVGLLNVDIIGADAVVGGLVGGNGGTVANSYATGSVEGSGNGVGGLVGASNGIITDSYATGSVSGVNFVGGLVGWNSGGITNSYATSSVSGSINIGGLVGLNNSGTIMNSYATGSISGGARVGGLVGLNWNSGTITNSYATGTVTGVSNVGGLVGWNSGGITNSYATGNISGEDDVGGLVGFNWNPGTITNSYATGSVFGTGDNVGGLVGWNRGSVTNSYATGTVTGASNVGGLVGNDSGTIENSYWDRNTSRRPTSDGDAVGKTTAELQSPIAPGSSSDDTYYNWKNDDWDFGTSSQYPVLKYKDNTNMDSSECRRAGDTSTDLPICGSLLSPTMRGLSELQLVLGELSPDFDVAVPNYRGTVANSTSTIRFRPITINTNAKVYITAEGQPRGLAIDSGDESSMISLNTDGITTITVEVENGGETTQTILYTLYLYYEFSRGIDRDDVDRDDDGLIEIDDLETLNAIRNQLDGSHLQLNGAVPTSMGCARGGCKGYELTRNLDFNDDDSYSSTANRVIWTTGAGWQPIGDSSSNAFTGKFEGNGFTISNLKINRSSTDGVGLFGYVRQGAEISNVGLLNVDITGNNRVGGLVGANLSGGTIINSYAIGAVSGSINVGGLVGANGISVGGHLVNGGTVAHSYATGSVSGKRSVGGLVSVNWDGTITNSYATGAVSGGAGVGGLVSYNSGGITNSYATGSVSGSNWIGGLVGANWGGTITNSYATGRVIGSGATIGGLVGFNNGGTITNSYATGAVTGEDDEVGGLVGGNDEGGTITNSYATGTVSGSGSSSNVGGLVGLNSSGTIENSYWDINTSGIRTGGSTEMRKTTEQLQSPVMPGPTMNDTYYDWSIDDWDFGTTKQYPAVKYAPGNDSSNPACDSEPRTPLPSCDSILPGQRGLPPIENTTPTVTITPSMPQTLPVGSTAHIVVSVVDDNFNLDDTVMLLAMSSSRTIVSVTPMQIADMTTDTITTFMLDAKQGGEVIITFTAIDIRGLRDSVELSVRVNTVPRSSGIAESSVRVNTTPTIMITPSTDQTLSLNSTARIVVSVADDNFNLDDIVTLSAISSSQTVVSVVPAQVTGISTDTITTFILSAEQNGETTITFTATDSGGLSASETVSMNVITVIRIHVRVFLEGLLQ